MGCVSRVPRAAHECEAGSVCVWAGNTKVVVGWVFVPQNVFQAGMMNGTAGSA